MSVESRNAEALNLAAARWFEELDERGVFITDDRLIVRRWNHWLAAQTGRSAEEVVGQPLMMLYPELVDRGVDEYYRDALAGEVRVLSESFHRFLVPITRRLSPRPKDCQERVALGSASSASRSTCRG